MDGPSQSIVNGHLSQFLTAERSLTDPAGLDAYYYYDEARIARDAIAHHFAALETPAIEVPPELGDLQLPFARADVRKPKNGCDQRVLSTETVTKLRRVASASGLTLNSLLLGTLASFLYERCGQAQFAIAQSYLGRQPEQMRAVGSFSSSAPLFFSFQGNPPLRSTCRHVLVETQRMMAVKVIGESPSMAVRYELNDLRPMNMPTASGVQGQGVPGFFVVATEYADGLLLLVLFDAGKYHEEGVEAFVTDWIEVLHQTHSVD